MSHLSIKTESIDICCSSHKTNSKRMFSKFASWFWREKLKRFTNTTSILVKTVFAYAIPLKVNNLSKLLILVICHKVFCMRGHSTAITITDVNHGPNGAFGKVPTCYFSSYSYVLDCRTKVITLGKILVLAELFH